MSTATDGYVNPIDPILRYARGSMLESTDNEVRRMLDVEGFPVESHCYLVYPVVKQLSFVAQTFLDFTRKEAQRLKPDQQSFTCGVLQCASTQARRLRAIRRMPAVSIRCPRRVSHFRLRPRFFWSRVCRCSLPRAADSGNRW
jgi:hypothetical protein